MTADQRPGSGFDQEPKPGLTPEIQNRINKAKNQIARVDYSLDETGIDDLYGLRIYKNGYFWAIYRTTEDLEDELLVAADKNEGKLDQNPYLYAYLSVAHANQPEHVVAVDYQNADFAEDKESKNIPISEVVNEIESILDYLGIPSAEEIKKRKKGKNKKTDSEWDPDLAFGYTDPPH